MQVFDCQLGYVTPQSWPWYAYFIDQADSAICRSFGVGVTHTGPKAASKLDIEDQTLH